MNFIKDESIQKLRGGYYTPLDLAVFIAKWVKEIHPEKVLEPSIGDGAFLSAFGQIGGLNGGEVTGLEINSEEANRARKRAESTLPNTKIYNDDFLSWAVERLGGEGKFDAVVGNPPFIRYQYLPESFQEKAHQISMQLGLPFTKHTNSWVSFILASMALLRPGGRLAMVVPAEIIHIPHARALRSYLGKECSRLVIIDPEELWFDETLQGAVILLAEKRSSQKDVAKGLGIYPVRGRDFLKIAPKKIFAYPTPINGKTVEGKWTRALLSPQTRTLLDGIYNHPELHRFKDIAEVDVGIVTGANNYFLVSDKTVKEYKLSKWAHPMFGRSEHSPGIIYDMAQHRANAKIGKPTNFIWFPKEALEKDLNAQAYIKYGERLDLHKRYKTSIRKHWYSVPSVYSTEIGMLKRAHNIPRLILNEARAYTTDTAYRIRSKVPSKRLVSSFVNSLTALSAELEGRHYGGGVLELVPSEIENLYIPIPKHTNINISRLDSDIRDKSTEEVLRKQDRKILGAIGLSINDQDHIQEAWNKMRNRRQRISTGIV